MKVYVVFKENVKKIYFPMTKFHELDYKVEGVYTTELGAKNKIKKLVKDGYETYYISQSLKGDLLNFIGKSEENQLKKEGVLRSNLTLKKSKVRIFNSLKLQEEAQIHYIFEVVKVNKEEKR